MSAATALRVRFWGVRGSHAMPGSSTLRIGGNSSCVEVSSPEHRLVFDAGTGIIGLGQELVFRARTRTVHIFLSHTHHDHIEGLRFFEPFYRSEWRCHLYGPGRGKQTLRRILRGAMQPRFFPVSLEELSARLFIRDLSSGNRVRLPGRRPIEVAAKHCHAHPKSGVILYRINWGGRSVVYATDVEAAQGGHEDIVRLARGADLLIHDAQYTDEEYFGGGLNKSGWGHSTVRMAAEVACEAGVGQLLLFHHDPSHDDRFVRKLERLAQKIFPASQAACEGMELSLRAAG